MSMWAKDIACKTGNPKAVIDHKYAVLKVLPIFMFQSWAVTNILGMQSSCHIIIRAIDSEVFKWQYYLSESRLFSQTVAYRNVSCFLLYSYSHSCCCLL